MRSPDGHSQLPPACYPTNSASQYFSYINAEPQTRWHQHGSSLQLWAACGAARVAAASWQRQATATPPPQKLLLYHAGV